MTIEIDKEFTDSGFIEALIDRIKVQLYDSIESRKSDIDAWNRYINENIKLFSRQDDYIDAKEILYRGANSLIYEESSNKFIIKIDEKQKINNVLLSVYNFCKLINYGNLSMRGANIFTNIFDNTKKDLDKLIDLYYSGEII